MLGTTDKLSPSGTEAESPCRPGPSTCRIGLTGNWRDKPAWPEEVLMLKNRNRLSLEWEKVARLLITAIEPVARLIDAISRLR